MSNEKLFKEFAPTTTEEWEKIVERDLKGADRTKRLVWNTYEGMKLEPYYRLENLKGLEYLKDNLPGEFPYVRGNQTSKNDWEIRQDIFQQDVKEANAQAKESLAKGAQGVCFVSKVSSDILNGVNVQTQEDFNALLNGIDLNTAKIHFDFGSRSIMAFDMLVAYCEANGVALDKVSGSIDYDPIANLAVSGCGLKKVAMMANVVDLVKKSEKMPNFKVIMISAKPYHNAGSNIAQEVAVAISGATEYLEALTDAGISTSVIAKAVGFNFCISSNYFLEIARLRSFRMLWSAVAKSFGAADEDCKAFVHCETSMWNKTIFDPNVNMLRTTTEAMSAILAGCSSLTVHPYDLTFKTPDSFSYRIARNSQIILKKESYLEKSIDPAAGSYYVENITSSLAEEVLELIKEIEADGGLYESIVKGSLQTKVKAVKDKKAKMISSRRELFLGTNSFPNLLEKMSDKIKFTAGIKVEDKCCAKEADLVNVEAFVAERGSEAFEKMRLKTEAAAKRPKVFMWTAGNLNFRKARANFIQNFFGCAGFDVLDNNGFDNVEDGMVAVKEYQPDIVVLCSSDDEYLELAKVVFPAVSEYKSDMIKVIAGAPKNADELIAAGAEEFVNVRTNAIDALTSYQEKLGVK